MLVSFAAARTGAPRDICTLDDKISHPVAFFHADLVTFLTLKSSLNLSLKSQWLQIWQS